MLVQFAFALECFNAAATRQFRRDRDKFAIFRFTIRPTEHETPEKKMNIPGDDWNGEAEIERFDDDGSYVCDSCGEEIVIPLDPAAGHSQSYVEDCPVCCNPNLIRVEWDGAHASVTAEAEQDPY